MKLIKGHVPMFLKVGEHTIEILTLFSRDLSVTDRAF